MKKTVMIIGIVVLFLLTAVGAFFLGRQSQNGKKEDTSKEQNISADTSKGNDLSQTEEKQAENSPSPKPVTFSVIGEGESAIVGEITYTITASWGDDKTTYTQIDAVITNQSEQDMASWEVNLTVPKGSKMNQGWNGKMKLKGRNLETFLNVLPEDYNAAIAAGQTANFGFIIETPSAYVPEESELILRPSKS